MLGPGYGLLVDRLPSRRNIYDYMLYHGIHHFTEEQAKFIAVCLLEALDYLHSMGFIYFDLKPENVAISLWGYPIVSTPSLDPITRLSADLS